MYFSRKQSFAMSLAEEKYIILSLKTDVFGDKNRFYEPAIICIKA